MERRTIQTEMSRERYEQQRITNIEYNKNKNKKEKSETRKEVKRNEVALGAEVQNEEKK